MDSGRHNVGLLFYLILDPLVGQVNTPLASQIKQGRFLLANPMWL